MFRIGELFTRLDEEYELSEEHTVFYAAEVVSCCTIVRNCLLNRFRSGAAGVGTFTQQRHNLPRFEAREYPSQRKWLFVSARLYLVLSCEPISVEFLGHICLTDFGFAKADATEEVELTHIFALRDLFLLICLRAQGRHENFLWYRALYGPRNRPENRAWQSC
jgi:hypothetical protein